MSERGCFYIVNILISKTFAEPKRWSYILLFPSAQNKKNKTKNFLPMALYFYFFVFLHTDNVSEHICT